MNDYWHKYRRASAHVGMLEVVADQAAGELSRYATLLRSWAEWSVARGMPAEYAVEVMRFAADMERRAADTAQHREHFERLEARHGFGGEEEVAE